ncbi:MAG: type II secretion system protein [Massilia sp.]|nr:type II secretion system protein [Massilia sp.]
MRRKSGFTLVELLIVMAIVALLLTIALPRYFGSLAASREVALQENLKVLRMSIDKFKADKGHYPETLDELVAGKYLPKVPVDQVTESDATWIVVTGTDGDEHGIVDVKSGAPGTARDGRPYEAF